MTRPGEDPSMNPSTDRRHGFRRLCLVVDLEGYSKRTGPGQAAAQAGLAEALDAAAAACGVRRASWHRQETGDGELAVLPPDEPEALVVSAFPAALDEALRAIHRRDDLFLRIRLVMHHGIAHPAPKGHAGAGVITACRIAEAGTVRRALAAAPGARMVLALSDTLFTDVIGGGYTHLSSSDFHQVRIEEQKFRGSAWLALPGVDPSSIESSLAGEDGSAAENPTAQIAQHVTADHSTVFQAARDITHAPNSIVTTVNGDFHMPGGHIGPRRG